MKAGNRKRTEDKIPEAQGKGGAHRAATIIATIVNSSFTLLPSALGWAAPPFITDDTGTQGKGNWQLELQYEYDRNDATANAGAGPVTQVSKVSLFNPVLTYGLLENVDVALGPTYLKERVTENGALTESPSGMGDTTVEIKWRFYESNGLSFAIKPGLTLPTGDENQGLGTGKTSWGVNFITTYEAKPWQVNANIAYGHARYKLAQDEAANRSDLWRVSAGAAYSVRDDLRLVGEAGVRTNPARDDPFLPGHTGRFAMAGFIYSPTDKIDLAVGYRKGLNDAEADWAFLAGATFRW